MIYNNINTPYELLEYMDNINYGFESKNKIKYDPNNEKFGDLLIDNWYLRSASEIIKSSLGICFDQVEIERDWFTKHNYDFKTIFIWFEVDYDNSYPTHTYLIYKDNKKYYYFEHSHYENKGIYEFDTFSDAINYQLELFIKYASSNNNISVDVLNTIHIYEYSNLKKEINFDEYIDDIITNGNDITSLIK